MAAPVRRKRVSPKRTPGQEDRFAILMYNIVQRFGRIQEDIRADNSKLRQEWRQARGLATWTEERLEYLEKRLDRLEQLARLPSDPDVEELRALLANYAPYLEELGIRPPPGSMMPPRK